jgi:hypothetical protein
MGNLDMDSRLLHYAKFFIVSVELTVSKLLLLLIPFNKQTETK